MRMVNYIKVYLSITKRYHENDEGPSDGTEPLTAAIDYYPYV